MVAVHTDAADGGRTLSVSGGARPGVATGLWLTAAGFIAVELAVSPGYGFHPDELYFLVAGRHPALGYVDQPPLAPLLTRLATSLFGDSPSAVRLMPALAGGALVIVAGLTARLLGGRGRAQVLAALAVGCAPVTLAAAHLANTTIYDMLAWSAITALTIAAVLHDRPRLWLAVGAVTEIGLEAKDLPLLLVIALLAGLAVTGRWQALWTPWLPAGAAVAVALWAPNLAWQATHGWPALTMSRTLSAEHSALGDYVTVLPAQLIYLGVSRRAAGVRRPAAPRTLPRASVPRRRLGGGAAVCGGRHPRAALLHGRAAACRVRGRSGDHRSPRRRPTRLARLAPRAPGRHRAGRGAHPADSAHRGHRAAAVPAQAQLRPRRDRRLAAADQPSRPGVRFPSAGGAGRREHLHKQLR